MIPVILTGLVKARLAGVRRAITLTNPVADHCMYPPNITGIIGDERNGGCLLPGAIGIPLPVQDWKSAHFIGAASLVNKKDGAFTLP